MKEKGRYIMLTTILGMTAISGSIILAVIGKRLLKGVGEKLADILEDLL